MKVTECMTRDVQVVGPDQPIRKAAQFMLKTDAGSIPVCDGDRLIGMVTDRDIAVRAVAQGRDPEAPVREIMTDDLIFCFEDDDVQGAAEKMSESKVRRLPIVAREGRKLVGIVSLGDLSQSDGSSAEHALEEITRPSPIHNQSRQG